MKDINTPVWLITGCSTGFGRQLAKAALASGFQVAVAARNTKDVSDIVNDFPETAVAVQLDVTKSNEITSAVSAAIKYFGKIDVLVNNAGIGYFGAIEESDQDETRRMFDINFFGLANMTREVLPFMRAQHSGHIINISSIGGLASFPGLGYYHATKYAVDGFSEALSKEVNGLGIKVTIVAPGAFRTDWAGRSAQETPGTITDYAETADSIKKWIRSINGTQPGDPAKAAKAIIKAVSSANPPLRLLLGKDALEGAREKLTSLVNDYNSWETTTLDVAFDK